MPGRQSEVGHLRGSPRPAIPARPRATGQGGAAGRVAAAGRVVVGVGLVAFSLVPLYRLLDADRAGIAARATRDQVDAEYAAMLYGLLIVGMLLLASARYAPSRLDGLAAAAGGWLRRLRTPVLAGGLAILAVVLASTMSLLVFSGMPHWLDSIVQATHARFWAEGRLAGPASDHGGFWIIQNSLFTDNGWVSQYPPGHVAVIAVFMKLGVPWLAGPFMAGVAVCFGLLTGERLLPHRRGAARLGAALLAVSPFFLFIAASFMNHVTVAAMVSVAAYGLVRAWQGRATWGLLAGAGFGWALCTRPLATAAMGLALFVLVPFVAEAAGRARRLAAVTLATGAGALPFVLALAAYNTHFFGSPSRFGYELALGPNMRLGFVQDPWGNLYGLREAVGYTSSDLLMLGVGMFESPLPALLVIGLFLVVCRRLAPGERVLLGWATAPVVANFFYWHHGLLMGPRMLHEAMPAWALLFSVAAMGLIERVPAAMGGVRLPALAPRRAVAVAIALPLASGILVLAPQRAVSHSGQRLPAADIPLPEFSQPALVFVHDAWTSRIAMTLAAHRVRLDIVETLLRQNPTCRLQALADALAAGDADAARVAWASLDTVPRAHSLPPTSEISRGNLVRLSPGEALTPECAQQARSDAGGILDIAPLLWRADLPDGPSKGALFVRDMGPARNRVLLERYPNRVPFAWAMRGDDAMLLQYDDGMAVLWPDLDSVTGATRAGGAHGD